jgi:hypothetical protein
LPKSREINISSDSYTDKFDPVFFSGTDVRIKFYMEQCSEKKYCCGRYLIPPRFFFRKWRIISIQIINNAQAGIASACYLEIKAIPYPHQIFHGRVLQLPDRSENSIASVLMGVYIYRVVKTGALV